MANVMTVDQAAAYLQLKPDTVRKGARTGKIPAARVCGRWRFLRDELDAWLKAGGSRDEPEVDAWLVAEADKAFHDKRYTSEEVKAALGL
jgi:excisionase family DNA binding protein